METIEEVNANIEIFFRCKKIIHGCNSSEQLETAKKYCQLYLDRIPKESVIDNLKIKQVEGFLSGMIHERILTLIKA